MSAGLDDLIALLARVTYERIQEEQQFAEAEADDIDSADTGSGGNEQE